MDTTPSQHFDVMDVDDAMENNSIPDINIPEKSQSESLSSSCSSSSSSSHSCTAREDTHNVTEASVNDNPSEAQIDNLSRTTVDNPSEILIDNHPSPAQSSMESYVTDVVVVDTHDTLITIPSENFGNQLPEEIIPSTDSNISYSTTLVTMSSDVFNAQQSNSTIRKQSRVVVVNVGTVKCETSADSRLDSSVTETVQCPLPEEQGVNEAEVAGGLSISETVVGQPVTGIPGETKLGGEEVQEEEDGGEYMDTDEQPGYEECRVEEVESMPMTEHGQEEEHMPVGEQEVVENMPEIQQVVSMSEEAAENMPEGEHVEENILIVEAEEVQTTSQVDQEVSLSGQEVENMPAVAQEVAIIVEQGKVDIEPEVSMPDEEEELVENMPQVNQEVENMPEVDQEVENMPEMDQEVENMPQVDQEVENMPQVEQEVQNMPEVDQEVQNMPEVDQEVDNVPVMGQEVVGEKVLAAPLRVLVTRQPLPVCLEEEMDDGTNDNNVISIPDDGQSSDLGRAASPCLTFPTLGFILCVKLKNVPYN